MEDLTCAICDNNFTIEEQKEYRLSSEPVCPSCAVHLRGYIDYRDKPAKYYHNIVKKCEECLNYYIKHNGQAQCPHCLDKLKTVHCQICDKEYISDKDLGKIHRGDILVCDECYDTLPGEGNHIIYCNSCDQIVRNTHNFAKCKNCEGLVLAKYIHSCQFCGSTMENNSPKPEVYTCDTCYRDRFVSQNHEIYKMLIQRDDAEIKGDILMFPLTINHQNDNRTRKFAEKTCLNCHRSFLPQGSRQYFCLCCYKIVTCKQCGKEFAGKCAGSDSTVPENVFCSKSCSCQHQMNHRTLYEHSSNTYEYDMIGTLEEYLVEMTKECPVNDDTVFYYSKVKGIWIKYDEDTSEVLDVMYTTNVEKEYNWIQNALKYNESDKYKALKKHKNITYYYVSSFTSELEGLMREMSFALNYKARYWSPSPGIQSHIMSKLRKEGKIYEETIRDQLG